MGEEESFFKAILAAPADDLPRLVYADWCDEHESPVRAATAEFIRLSCPGRTRMAGEIMPKVVYPWLKDNWRRLVPALVAMHRPEKRVCKTRIAGDQREIYFEAAGPLVPTWSGRVGKILVCAHHHWDVWRYSVTLDFLRGFLLSATTYSRTFGPKFAAALLEDQPVAKIMVVDSWRIREELWPEAEATALLYGDDPAEYR